MNLLAPIKIRFSKIAAFFCLAFLLGETSCSDAAYDRIPERIDGYEGIHLFIFHASWCSYCNAELPMLKSLHRDYAPCGIRFLGVNEDDSKEIMEDFVKKAEIPYPVVHWDFALMKKFGHPRAIPSHFLVDSSGNILLRKIGPLDSLEIREKLDGVLGKSLRNCRP